MTAPAPHKTPLVHYDAACRELALASSIDEVKKIRDKTIAIKAYAKQAKDRTLYVNAAKITKRAERRLGEVMAEDRKAGKLAKAPGGSKARPRKDRVAKGPNPSFADQGVDKHLADRARKAAAMPADKFEKEVERVGRIAAATLDNDREVIREAKANLHVERKVQRAEKETALGAKQKALPTKKYGVIYADPEWKFEVWSEKGLTNTSAGNHYPTSELNEIKNRGVPSIAADDCVFFLWATVPMLPQALEVMKAWGFEYKSHVVWIKDKSGTGYWFRNKHEVLLVGVRGKIPAPAPGDQFPSAIEAPVGAHSAKPPVFYELIESYFPSLPKIELNARQSRAGWEAWGLEAPSTPDAPEGSLGVIVKERAVRLTRQERAAS